jgi:hypothetical protein
MNNSYYKSVTHARLRLNYYQSEFNFGGQDLRIHHRSIMYQRIDEY